MLLMLVSAVAEVISLGAVLPFIGILTAPQKVFSHPMLAELMRVWGITSPDELVLPFTMGFAIAALSAGAIRLLLLWASTRLAFACGADLSIEVYRRTLYQPYCVHVNRNSSEVINGITNKVNGVVFGVLLPVLILLSSVVLLIAVTSALIAIDPLTAMATTLGFGLSYGAIAFLFKRKLNRNSERIATEQTQVIKVLQEGLGGIRDILLDGTQAVYCDAYRRADRPLRVAQGDNIFMGHCPRYAIEALGMMVIAVVAYVLSRQSGGIAMALPVLGALALGAQRILPALQQGYNAWAVVIGNHASVIDTLQLLDQPLSAEAVQPPPPPLVFLDNVTFNSVRFRYRSDGPWIVNGLSIVIPKGARVGIVGRTGSGKSTVLDLLMGLVVPTEGEILVDGQPIAGNRLRAWQRTIAHVPQSIFLADTTIAENIALGVPAADMDMARIRLAARQAQITDCVESQSEGYNTIVGERGVRLSGGQRQRIGIARALYKQASVLVFDEATSALDDATEQSVMDAINALDRDLTVLLIAHRLTTVRCCDMILELESGRVVAQGTYDDLLATRPIFRRSALAHGE